MYFGKPFLVCPQNLPVGDTKLMVVSVNRVIIDHLWGVPWRHISNYNWYSNLCLEAAIEAF